MIKGLRLFITPIKFQRFNFQPSFYFAKISKKEQEKQAKQIQKQTLNLASSIDFEPFIKKFEDSQHKIKDALQKLSVNKLTPDMLEGIKILTQGEKLPISALAQVSVKGQGQLTINCFEDSTISEIVKALENSDLNLQLKKQDKVITAQLTAGNTKESRLLAVTQMKKMIEEQKDKLRGIRHESLETIKPYKKVAPEDVVKKAEKQVQEIYEKQITQLEQLAKNKEKELMGN